MYNHCNHDQDTGIQKTQTYLRNSISVPRLPTLQGTSGVKIKYRMECYDQIGRTSVKPCPMTLRKEMLKGLALSEDYTITSDIYIFDPEGLVCTKEVTIEMPVMSLDVPEKGEIILKVKADGSWSDCKVFEKVKK